MTLHTDPATLVGIVGVALVLGMYVMLQVGRIRPETLTFSAANFVGSALILVSLYFHWNLPSVIIEVVWMATSIWGMVKYWRHRKAG